MDKLLGTAKLAGEDSKPTIYAKASLSHEQIDVKNRIGCDGIEIQLLNELVADREKHIYRNTEDAFNLSEFANENIKVVHCPLLSGVGDVLLEMFVDTQDIELLDRVCYIANYYGTEQHKTIVVIHSESYYSTVSDLGDTWERIKNTINYLLYFYPNIEIVIENVSPIRGIGKGGNMHLSNNFGFDNIEMIRRLRDELHTDRVGTCLDTCHAMLTDKYISALYREVADREPEDYSMKKFFEENKEYCKLIHLADIKGSGYGKGRHGVSFEDNPQSIERLKEIINLYKVYDYKCPITLEVEETDYLTCEGFANTKDMVLRLW